EEARKPALQWFLVDSGLNELGESNNDIIDALRPVNQAEMIDTAVNQVHSSVTDGRRQLKASEWSAALCRGFAGREQQFISEVRVAIETRARDEWLPGIQRQVR